MSFGTESATPVGGQTLTGFIVSKAMQSRKDAKKEDRKQKRKEKKQQQTKKDDKQQQQKQGIGSKLLGSFPSLGNLFSYKKPETKSSQQAQRTRTSGGTTGLAKILTQGFGSLTADTMGLASGLASVTQLLNSSLKAQTFTATGVQTITSILSDQVENQGSILSTVKSLKPGGGTGGGGKSMFGSSKSSSSGGETLTGFLIQQAIDRGIGKFIQGSLSKLLNPFKKLMPGAAAKPAASAGTKVATESVESIAKKKLAQEIVDKGLKSKGAIVGGKYISMTAAEAAQSLAPKAAAGPLAKMGGMFTGLGAKLGMKGGGASIARLIPGIQTAVGLGLAGKELSEGDITGAVLAGGSAIPIAGWGFLGMDVAREIMGNDQFDKTIGQAFSGDFGLSDAKIEQRYTKQSALERVMTTPSMPMPFSKGGVMLGEAGKEAVVDLNSNQGRDMMDQQKDDPGMKASGASTLAVVDQFIKGMGSLGAPVSQALGPDISNLSRTFGMSQTLPNLKIGGGKFKEDGNAKKSRDKFLEELIAGSLKALDAKKKDEKKVEKKTPPPGDPNQERSEKRQSETKDMLERIPGAGKAMEIVAPAGVQAREGEKAFQTEKTVKGTEVKLASGDRLMVPSADLNPVTHSNKKYWYDNQGQIFKWKPGEKVTQVYLNQVQQQGAADGFDLVRDLNTGVVRQVPVKDMNPFNNVTNIKPGEYSYRAHGVLTPEKAKDGKPIWDRNDAEDDIRGIHGPTIAIPKQSNLTQFQRGGQVEQKPWWDFMGRFIDTHRNSKPEDYSNPNGLGANLARQRQMMKELGYEKGGSLFGTESSNIIPLEQRVKALEDIIAVTSITAVSEPQRKIAPKASPSSVPIGATNQTASSVDSTMIVNVIGGGDSGQVVASNESPQSSSDYISDPWPGGLAGVLCSSPWSVV